MGNLEVQYSGVLVATDMTSGETENDAESPFPRGAEKEDLHTFCRQLFREKKLKVKLWAKGEGEGQREIATTEWSAMVKTTRNWKQQNDGSGCGGG